MRMRVLTCKYKYIYVQQSNQMETESFKTSKMWAQDRDERTKRERIKKKLKQVQREHTEYDNMINIIMRRSLAGWLTG